MPNQTELVSYVLRRKFGSPPSKVVNLFDLGTSMSFCQTERVKKCHPINVSKYTKMERLVWPSLRICSCSFMSFLQHCRHNYAEHSKPAIQKEREKELYEKMSEQGHFYLFILQFGLIYFSSLLLIL